MHRVAIIVPCKMQQVSLTGVNDADRAVAALLEFSDSNSAVQKFCLSARTALSLMRIVPRHLFSRLLPLPMLLDSRFSFSEISIFKLVILPCCSFWHIIGCFHLTIVLALKVYCLQLGLAVPVELIMA